MNLDTMKIWNKASKTMSFAKLITIQNKRELVFCIKNGGHPVLYEDLVSLRPTGIEVTNKQGETVELWQGDIIKDDDGHIGVVRFGRWNQIFECYIVEPMYGLYVHYPAYCRTWMDSSTRYKFDCSLARYGPEGIVIGDEYQTPELLPISKG